MVAAKGLTPHTTMYTVCLTLQSAWDLDVLCPCQDENPQAVCYGACTTSSIRCMGESVYVSPTVVFCHAHPNALDAIGALKFGAPLQSYWATSSRRTTNVFLSTLFNALPFLRSWGAFLFSTVMWMQLAVLSGYLLHAVCTSMQTAVHCLLAKTAWDVPRTLQWILFIAPRLPQPWPTLLRTSWRGSGGLHIGTTRGTLRGTCTTVGLVPNSVLIGHLTCLLYYPCLASFPSSLRWTGASTGGGGRQYPVMHNSTRISS